MKNEALEEATELARSVYEALPDLRLHGDGTMRDPDDTPVHPGILGDGALPRAHGRREAVAAARAQPSGGKSPTRGA